VLRRIIGSKRDDIAGGKMVKLSSNRRWRPIDDEAPTLSR
jgi:hypothetical protein